MKLSILLFGAALLCSSVLRAGTVCTTPDTLELGCIYTNFGTGQTFQQDVGLTPGYSAVGVSFTASGSWLLANIEVAVYRANSEIADFVNFSLYDSQGGFPGNLLETFTLSGIGVAGDDPAPSSISAESVLHPLLENGMQYWMVMDGINPGDVTWNWNSTGQLSGVASVIAPVPDGPPAHWANLSNYPQGAFALDGSPAPEPASFLLLIAPLAALTAFRKRRASL